jgi:hypothetical protein
VCGSGIETVGECEGSRRCWRQVLWGFRRAATWLCCYRVALVIALSSHVMMGVALLSSERFYCRLLQAQVMRSAVVQATWGGGC